MKGESKHLVSLNSVKKVVNQCVFSVCHLPHSSGHIFLEENLRLEHNVAALGFLGDVVEPRVFETLRSTHTTTVNKYFFFFLENMEYTILVVWSHFMVLLHFFGDWLPLVMVWFLAAQTFCKASHICGIQEKVKNTYRNSSHKNDNLLKMYSLSVYPRYRWVCFLIRPYLKKCSIT